MKAVVQRAKKAKIFVNNAPGAEMGLGLVILLGVGHNDGKEDADWLAKKIAAMRIFSDAEGKMNLSLKDVGGEALIVSQFTLHASTKKGNRPSYAAAAKPEKAVPLYEYFIESFNREAGIKAFTGEFGAHMQIDFINDGPVTIIVDTEHN